jgi:glucose-1-phosphate cytidylyltransferase
MKVVLFCGGLGTRIRDCGDNIPKPMTAIGDKPILWHLMNSYSVSMGTRTLFCASANKASTIKEFFLGDRRQLYSDCGITQGGTQVELLGKPRQDWHITMIDTGVWRNVGERLRAVREHVQGEEIFMANYSDGLAAVNLPEIIETFRQSGKVGCFLAVRLSFSLHLVNMTPEGQVKRIRSSEEADLWINGGFFIFRPEIFDYMREGEELVETPFRRLVEADKLLAVRHEGFRRPMDTLKERQVLEELIESGIAPWVGPEAQRGKLATNRKNA